jgi:hypothetical protein
MKRTFSISLASAVIIMGMLVIALNLNAKTPDGQPPAEEEVCLGETGSAYGLCNAYCEAMDCDSDDPKASEKACNALLRNYQRITGYADFPCEEADCFDANDWIGTGDLDGFLEDCLATTNCQPSNTCDGIYDSDLGYLCIIEGIEEFCDVVNSILSDSQCCAE